MPFSFSLLYDLISESPRYVPLNSVITILVTQFLYFAQKFSLQEELIVLLTDVLELLGQFKLLVAASHKSFENFSNRAVSLFKGGFQVLLELLVTLTDRYASSEMFEVGILGHAVLFCLQFLDNQIVVVVRVLKLTHLFQLSIELYFTVDQGQVCNLFVLLGPFLFKELVLSFESLQNVIVAIITNYTSMPYYMFIFNI